MQIRCRMVCSRFCSLNPSIASAERFRCITKARGNATAHRRRAAPSAATGGSTTPILLCTGKLRGSRLNPTISQLSCEPPARRVAVPAATSWPEPQLLFCARQVPQPGGGLSVSSRIWAPNRHGKSAGLVDEKDCQLCLVES